MTSRVNNNWKSLCNFLQTFQGELISVELKNDLVITGIVDDVDSDMSIMLGKASQKWIEGPRKGRIAPDMELVCIAGKTIRYVHFPDNLNIDSHLRNWKTRTEKGMSKRNYIVDRPKSEPFLLK